MTLNYIKRHSGRFLTEETYLRAFHINTLMMKRQGRRECNCGACHCTRRTALLQRRTAPPLPGAMAIG